MRKRINQKMKRTMRQKRTQNKILYWIRNKLWDKMEQLKLASAESKFKYFFEIVNIWISIKNNSFNFCYVKFYE